MILIIKHIDVEGPGIIGEFFRKKNCEVKTIDLEKGQSLPWNLDNIQAVITLGGPMNVYEEDKYPFLKEEDRFLKESINKEVPLLGICLGAQLLAKAAGASVGKAKKKEIGWFKVNLTQDGKEDPLFSDLDENLDVFQWHEDQFEIPMGGSLLASSKRCKNQAFRIGKSAYGLQFHIEVTPGMIKSWINEYVNKKSKEIDPDSILRDTNKKKDWFSKQAERFMTNFLKIINSKR